MRKASRAPEEELLPEYDFASMKGGIRGKYVEGYRSGTNLSQRLTRSAARPNSAKSAELQIIIWFLEAGWELFTPVADIGSDIVVRHPETRQLLAVQVKHKQPGGLNEGWLQNDWRSGEPPFDYLIFYVPEKTRLLVVPREKLKKAGKVFVFFAKDKEGYPRGPVRPLFASYFLDLSTRDPDDRAAAFTRFFSEVHESRTG